MEAIPNITGREEGFYHVKRNGMWTIGEWNVYGYKSWWQIVGSPENYGNSAFDEIDENRIERGTTIRPDDYKPNGKIASVQIGLPNPNDKIDWMKQEEYDELRERLLMEQDKMLYGQSFEILKDGKIYRLDPTTIKYIRLKNEIEGGKSPIDLAYDGDVKC